MMKNLNYVRFFQQFIVLSLLVLLSTQVLAGKRTTTYMHTDALGSVVAASDKDGNLLWRKQYMPFGSEINRDPTLKELSFTGKKFDAELGLSYSGARYYDPSLGRFGGIDPATALENVEPNPMMFNRYAYANNNPYRYVDPDGNVPVETVWDGVSIIYDIGKITVGYVTGNAKLQAEGAMDLAVDTVTFFVPYVPAGSSKIARATGEAAGLGYDATVKSKKAVNAVKSDSKKVKDVMDVIKQNDVNVKVNPRNKATKQEGNVTLDFGDGTKANLRVETHPLSQNGPPIRHGNVEVTKKVKNKNKVIKNTHITED